MKIALTGASGFIGGALLEELTVQIASKQAQAELIALSRSREGVKKINNVNVNWKKCDLFSLLDIEKALTGVDIAFYLIHSMSPSAGLVQGSFDELDLLLADNFIKACKKANVKKIVYLGGLLPSGDPKTWSTHLKSRHEVEEILGDSGIDVTILRAGLVVGKNGSSFEILRRLVLRLPVMACPAWTQSHSSAVSLDGVVKALIYALDHPVRGVRVYDLGETKEMSYRNMMREMAIILGKKPKMISIPLFTPRLSRFWVSLVTGAPRDLVYPLVMSLKHSLLPREENKCPVLRNDLSFQDIVTTEMLTCSERPHAYHSYFSSMKTVRSVQRVNLEGEVSGEFVAKEYMRWLPKFYYPFLKVEVQNDVASFYLRGISRPLMVLALSHARSSGQRQLFYIKGGMLARKGDRGRFEFRVLNSPRVMISAVHDFMPRLPWWIYKYTQALVHLFAMVRFGDHINKIIIKRAGDGPHKQRQLHNKQD